MIVILIIILLLIGCAIGILYLVKVQPDTQCISKETDYIAMIMYGMNSSKILVNKKYSQLLSNYVRNVPVKENRLLFYIGDLLQLNGNDILNYFNIDKIFYGVTIFSKEWALQLINTGVYIPNSIDDIFMICGYYKKHLPNSLIDIICFNSEQFINEQLIQLKTDLNESNKNKRNVYMLIWNYKNIWNKIDDKYKSNISGIFTSTQTKVVSLGNWSSKLGDSHIWNIPNDVSYIEISFPLLKSILIAQTDVKY